MENDKKDFVLDSKRRCFLCSNKISEVKHELESGAQPHSKHSLYCLSRYLKMDMRKVFSNVEQIPSELLAKVECSRLKVELCEKCTSLNKTFARLYRQLEKLEVEMNSSLGLIREELLGADGNLINLRSNSLREVSQIVDVLREEAFQKCSKKLGAIQPRVKIGKLTKKQIDAELAKHKTNSGVTKMDAAASFPIPSSEPGGSLKAELDRQIENLLSDDETRNYDMVGEVTDDEHTNITDVPWSSANDINKNPPVIVPAATTSTNRIEKRNHSINLGAGRWKCKICLVEFTSSNGVNDHYQSVHLKIRYKCVTCGKQFSNKQNYNRHLKSARVGVRYSCQVCKQSFTQSGSVRLHQRKTDCGKKLGLK